MKLSSQIKPTEISISEFKDYINKVVGFFDIDPKAIEIVDEGVPHKRYTLPKGKYAVYLFEYRGTVLKIGKAGPKSTARFNYQHYLPNSSRSNLAKSLLADENFLSAIESSNREEKQIGKWIKEKVRRINILIDVNSGIFTLNLIEAILQFRYDPKYEGFHKQR